MLLYEVLTADAEVPSIPPHCSKTKNTQTKKIEQIYYHTPFSSGLRFQRPSFFANPIHPPTECLFCLANIYLIEPPRLPPPRNVRFFAGAGPIPAVGVTKYHPKTA